MLATVGWTSWHRLHRVTRAGAGSHGRDDPIVPPVNGRILAAGLPRATVETIDCGHLFVLTRPREIAQRVERFIADVDTSGPMLNPRRRGPSPRDAEPGEIA